MIIVICVCQSLVDTGTDIETVRRLMGHKNLRTTQVYLGRTDKQRREHVETLALLARLLVLVPPPAAVRRLFFVLSA